MSKKKELKALRDRVARLEVEVAALHAERLQQVHIVREPFGPGFPGPWPPQITCTANKIDGAALDKALTRQARLSGVN